MVQIRNLSSGLPVFRALGSHVRAAVFSYIIEHAGCSIGQISHALSIPATTLVSHLHTLEESGLIISIAPVSHGGIRRYYAEADTDQIFIRLLESESSSSYRAEISVGSYSGFDVKPTCGLATAQAFIGQLDEPRYFAHPLRYQAQILWFTEGYVEYILPNFIPLGSVIDELSLSFEISSEAPQFRDVYPSDITFLLNDVRLGTWTSPGDFGERRGYLNPSWWYPFLNQYGLLKKLRIDRQGCFLDEEQLSGVTVSDLALTDQSILRFRFCVLPDSAHVGGCTLFGRSFGDHNQELALEILYRTE